MAVNLEQDRQDGERIGGIRGSLLLPSTVTILFGGHRRERAAARPGRHGHGVHFRASFWLLTDMGERLAQDPELLRAVCVDVEGKPKEVRGSRSSSSLSACPRGRGHRA